MRIHIGSDHAGLELKAALVEYLKSKGHDVKDHGPHEYDAVDDYPDFCIPAAIATVADPSSLGIVLGGSGNGEQMIARRSLMHLSKHHFQMMSDIFAESTRSLSMKMKVRSKPLCTSCR